MGQPVVLMPGPMHPAVAEGLAETGAPIVPFEAVSTDALLAACTARIATA